MTKAQLIDVVAKKAHLPKTAAKEAVNAVFEEVIRSLEKGDKVVVSGFGTFYVNKVDDKLVVPFGKESEKKVVKSHRVVNFRVGKPLREKVW
jgi:nucleoid DNA-binding protein